MENASKALIIAGAILLSIAIIGIGMYVFNMASSVTESINMSEQEIDAYNSTFVRYQGTITGAQARTLCDTIRTHNSQATDDVSKQIVLRAGNGAQACTGASVAEDTVGTDTTAITTARATIRAGSRYSVAFNYTATGMIKEISILPTAQQQQQQ